MSTKRYNFKGYPGPTTTLSFRVPAQAIEIFDLAVAEAEGIANRTEAMQDAFVKWIMLEELYRAQRQSQRTA